tara:strand:- start:26497 stop:26862 length:366 start_codon:yes stop_codon:yes gene_type:complete
MAKLTHILTLSSTTTGTDELNMSSTDTLTVEEPMINTSRMSIPTGGSTAVLDGISGKASYLYMKVISGVATTDYVEITIAGTAIGKVRIEETLWIPLKDNMAVTARAYGNACIIEYGQWAV